MLSKFFHREGKPKMRATPDRSLREITEAKERLGAELRAALYLYDEKQFIVSAISGITESGPPLVLSVSDPDEALGLALCDKLLEFGVHDPGNAREQKLDDWGVFKASGAKTGKHFEAHSFYIGIETIRTAIVLKARPRVSPEPALYAGATLSNGADHEKIGATVRRLIVAVKALRQADVL